MNTGLNQRFPQERLSQDRHPADLVLAGLRNIFANKFKIGFLCLSAAVAAYYASELMPKIYTSSVTLSIEGEVDGTSRWDQAVPGPTTIDKSFLYTQYELLVSRDLAEDIAANQETIGCDRPDPSAVPSADPQSAKAFEVIRNITVEPIRNTTLFRISAFCHSPAAAKQLAEMYAAEFIRFKQSFYRTDKAKASDWVETQMSTLESNLIEAERALQEFKEQESIYSSEVDSAVGNVEVESLLGAFSAEQKKLAELKAVDQQIRNLGADYQADQLASIPRIRDDRIVGELIIQLSRVTATYNELTEKYHDDFPDVVAERGRYNELMRQLRAQVSNVVSGISQELKASEVTLANIEADLAKVKNKTISQDRKRATLAQLEHNVKVNRDLFHAFMEKSGDLAHSKGFFDDKIKIVNRAYESRRPVSPDPIKWSALAFAAALLMAGGYCFIRGARDGTVKVATEVELNLHAALLGILPAVKTNKSALAYGGFVEDSDVVFSEGIRSIRTSLKLLDLDGKNIVTVVTSSTKNEGKSTTALNLAAAFARLERTLLIDADVRRPTLGLYHGMHEMAPGLIDTLCGSKSVADCIVRGQGQTYDFLPAGRISATMYHNNPGLRSPLELLSSDTYVVLLERLREHYDRIVIDTAPVCGISDAKVISRGATQVVYVVAAHQTDRRLVKQGMRELQLAGASVAGIVLNRVDMREFRHGYGSYGADYTAKKNQPRIGHT